MGCQTELTEVAGRFRHFCRIHRGWENIRYHDAKKNADDRNGSQKFGQGKTPAPSQEEDAGEGKTGSFSTVV